MQVNYQMIKRMTDAFTMLFHRGPCYWIIRKLLRVLGHIVHNVALHCLEGTFHVSLRDLFILQQLGHCTLQNDERRREE